MRHCAEGGIGLVAERIMAHPPPAPPQRSPSSSFNADPGAAAWISSLVQYLGLRRAHVDPNHPTTIMEWLRLQILREHIPEGRQDRRRRPDAFGLQRPLQDTLLNWPARVTSDGGQPLGTARIEATGKEALTLALPFDLQPERTIRLQIATGVDQQTTLTCWPVWQSRVQINRWRIGVAVLEISHKGFSGEGLHRPQ